MAQDSEPAVRKWLEDTGFPLEMEVATAFRKAGFVVRQSDHYLDPESGEPREIDVVAALIGGVGESGRWRQVSFNVECKRSVGKPWVVFVGDRKLTEGQLLRHFQGDDFAERLLRRSRTALAPQQLPMLTFSEVGYGMAQALRSKDGLDDSYRALMQVSKATRAAVTRATDVHMKQFYVDPQELDIFVGVSAIVVDGEIYGARLDDKGTLQLKKRDQHVILWSNPVSGSRFAVPVYVVTKEGLPSFIEGARATWGALEKWLVDHVGEVSTMAADHLKTVREAAKRRLREQLDGASGMGR